MHVGEKSECWQGPHLMAWRAGLWPAGRLLHTPALTTHHRHKTYLLCRHTFSGYKFMFFSIYYISPQSCLTNIVIKISLTNAITTFQHILTTFSK